MKFSLVIAGALLLTSASAAPFPTPELTAAVGTMYLFTTTSTGGTGNQEFSVKLPPNGYYMVSYTANFSPAGSPASPVVFQCLMQSDGNDISQSTAAAVSESDFAIGVNGQAPVRVLNGTNVKFYCGTADGSMWTWAAIPLRVTFARMAGEVEGAPLKNAAATIGKSAFGIR
jgi:hypothetical protein